MPNNVAHKKDANLTLILKSQAQEDAREDFAKQLADSIDEQLNDSIDRNIKYYNNVICLSSFRKQKFIRKNKDELSVLEAALLELELEINNSFNLPSVFSEVEQMFAKKMYKNKIKINYDFNKEKCNLNINYIYLKIILYYALGNAIEFSRNSTEISCRIQEVNSNLMITIKDKGFEYNSCLATALRRVRGDSNLFFTEEFIINLIKIVGGSITQKYIFDIGNTRVISLPLFQSKFTGIINFPRIAYGF